MTVATIKLNFPIKGEDGKDLSELVFLRRPKGKDLIGTSGIELTYPDLFLVAGRVLNIPPPLLSEMDLSDVMQLSKLVAGFLSNSLPIGEKS